MSGSSLGLLSLGLVAAAIGAWLRAIDAVAIERRRPLLLSACAAGVVLGGVALAREPGWTGGLMAVGASVGGTAWIALALLAGQSKQRPHLGIGEPLPPIVAPDHDGSSFAVESLRGHPVLIKLFRGHW